MLARLIIALLLVSLGVALARLPIIEMVFGEGASASLQSELDEMNRTGTSFVERMKTATERATRPQRRSVAPTPSTTGAGTPAPAVPVKTDAQREQEFKASIDRLFTPPKEAMTTASGLTYQKLTAKEGAPHPRPTGAVRAHFSVWARSGERIVAALPQRKELLPIVPLRRLPLGLREGLLLMREGEVAKLWIPSQLAYGDESAPLGAPSGPLMVDVVLFDVFER